MIKLNTTFGNLPEEGEIINALTTDGFIVRAEVVGDPERFFLTGKNRDYFRGEIVGWWLDAPAEPAPMSEAEKRFEHRAEEEDNQRQFGLEDDREALASAGFIEED